MRKLTVKNFSVIKEAELEFGKITVLIGPQSSGKSLLCRLAYFLGPTLTEIIGEFAARERPWSYLEEFASIQFHQRFPESAWGSSDFSVQYQQAQYSVKATGGPAAAGRGIAFEFSDDVKLFYSEKLSSPWGKTHEPEREAAKLTTSFRTWNYLLDLYALQGHRTVESSTFIPASRSFFSNLNNVFELFRNENVDTVFREFASNLDWTPELTSFPSVTPVIAKILEDMEVIQGGKVRIDDGKPAFEGAHGIVVPMGLTSSGTQELVPLFMLLTQLIRASNALVIDGAIKPIRDRFLIVEEPEGHIFPTTQYELVRLLTWLTNEPTLGFSWVLTTHSPYVLSAFNNLIEAKQVAKSNPESKDEVAKLIPERYWVNAGDFKAYSIHDGILESIIDEETHLINGAYLDAVSNEIGSQFDELLRIGYVKA